MKVSAPLCITVCMCLHQEVTLWVSACDRVGEKSSQASVGACNHARASLTSPVGAGFSDAQNSHPKQRDLASQRVSGLWRGTYLTSYAVCLYTCRTVVAQVCSYFPHLSVCATPAATN